MMPENLSVGFQSLLDAPIISRVRRNHGLEHATLHVLAERNPGLSIAGHSNPGGFWILGDVSTKEVRSAVDEALKRLRGGEGELAVHPNCGTNFVIAGTAAGVAGALAMFGSGRRVRDKLERLPLAASFATLALILAQPLGNMIQRRVTTSGEPEFLEVVEVIESDKGRIKAHKVVTEG